MVRAAFPPAITYGDRSSRSQLNYALCSSWTYSFIGVQPLVVDMCAMNGRHSRFELEPYIYLYVSISVSVRQSRRLLRSILHVRVPCSAGPATRSQGLTLKPSCCLSRVRDLLATRRPTRKPSITQGLLTVMKGGVSDEGGRVDRVAARARVALCEILFLDRRRYVRGTRGSNRQLRYILD